MISEQDLHLSLTDRAFQYNDGFFETAIFEENTLRFWHQHKQRMQEAAKAFQLQLPPYLLEPEFEEQLKALAQREQAATYGRLKLKVWRSGGGLYQPQTNSANWLATVQPASPALQSPVSIGICQHVHTAPSPLSPIKGPNAPLYVLAGLEKQATQQDDMLLLSPKGMVAECISSNIFWLKGQTLYTPPLATGCVNGILRRVISKWTTNKKMVLLEVEMFPEQLYLADAVFQANVTGVRGIASIGNVNLSQNEDLLTALRQDLNL